MNEALRYAERRRVFNVQALCQLAAESVGRSPGDVINFVKLAEELAVASEVATMDFLRSSGLPVPEVYGYSPASDNAAETEYIFMEFVEGTDLSDVWSDLGESEINSVLCELAQLESKMMSIAFPAGGSLYYAKDLEKMTGRPGILLEDGRFCVGPDTRPSLWYGRRSQLDVDRGPYESAETTLVKGAHKELAYLQRFGQPLLPFQRLRRESYKYEEQSPLDHVKNIDRYLRIASSLVPRDPALCHFCISHPDLQQGNIFVSKSSGSKWKIVGLIDWQHASILPLFLLARVPKRFQNFGDPIPQSMTQPSLPENMDDLDETKQSQAKELYRCRIIHYHYIKNTEEHNKLHYAALTDPVGMLRRRLFAYASDPWEGETLALKVALIEATKYWKTFTRADAPCPVVFDAEDVRKTMKLDEEQTEADEILQFLQSIIGFGPEGWVTNEHYETAMEHNKLFKEAALARAESEKQRDGIMEHWFLDDMDEEKYM
ncbi:hypothetical protein C0992_004462 [Termitomyces sp. T32_za158]|nr:hypothetical protein C0992_004462 [Termitomyces sp. T32_za158]